MMCPVIVSVNIIVAFQARVIVVSVQIGVCVCVCVCVREEGRPGLVSWQGIPHVIKLAGHATTGGSS